MAKKTAEKKPVTQEVIDQCLAAAVAKGDLVNFRFLFLPYSPLRQDASENIEAPKYAYLLPEDPGDAAYQKALELISSAAVQAHVQAQLTRKGPAQLPWEPLLLLADNAVRRDKYATAAQAYELLRIRRRMQDLVYTEAEAALDAGAMEKAVRGFRVAVGLEYDYMAFPEPLPYVPNYQERALMLHAEYPRQPEDCIALLPPAAQLSTALNYLLLRPEAAARLEKRDPDLQARFIDRLIRVIDPDWSAFCQRYQAACEQIDRLGEGLADSPAEEEGLQEEIAAQQKQDFAVVMETLLGRRIEGGEWWQYLKELAYAHPASALFVSRQIVPGEQEIIMPRFRKDSPLNACFALNPAGASS